MNDCRFRSESINSESYLIINKTRSEVVLVVFRHLSEILCQNPLSDLNHASTSCSIVQIQVFLQNVSYLYFLSFLNQQPYSFLNLINNCLQPAMLRVQSFQKFNSQSWSSYVQIHYFSTLFLNLSMRSLLLTLTLYSIKLYFK